MEGASSASTLTLTLLLLLCLAARTAASHGSCPASEPDSDLSILHIHGHCSPFRSAAATWLDSVLSMAAYADPNRVSYLSTLATNRSATLPVAPGHVINTGNYVVRVQVGSPGQVMFMVLDTSSDATWLPCTGCVGCGSSVFNSSASATFELVDCSLPQCSAAKGASCSTESGTGSGSCLFNQTYGGNSSFTATLSRDVLLLSNDVVRNYAFGCMTSVSGTSTPPQGLLGLGRGAMSLISQAGSLYSGVFSYCLPSFRSYYFSGSLKLGPE